MDLPEQSGTYILWSRLALARSIDIGRLGRFPLSPGYYAYVGSAFGSGGIKARLEHHLESIANPHWHIDYLLQSAVPLEVWYALADRKLEQDWAQLLERTSFLRQPIPRFGSSDYRRSRTSHLFHSRKSPSFTWFVQTVRNRFTEDIVPRRLALSGLEFTVPPCETFSHMRKSFAGPPHHVSGP